jgi:hypothetical protein
LSEPAADDEDGEVEEPDDEDTDREATESEEESKGDAPKVEEPADEDIEPAPVSATSALGGLKASAVSLLTSLGLVPSAPEGEGVAEGEGLEQGGDKFSTILTVAVFVAFRVLLSLAVRFFGRAATEGGSTPLEQVGAVLSAGPLGPLVKALHRGWGSVAGLARSPYAAPVVMSLMIVALKLIGSMPDAEEADYLTEQGGAAEASAEEADAEADEADGTAEATKEEDAIDASGVETEASEEE